MTEATNKFIEKRESAEQEYVRVVKLCRVAFRNNKPMEALIPPVISLSPFDNWILKTYNLYGAIMTNNEALLLLLRFGLTSETMQTKIDGLDEVASLKNDCDIEKGDAQQATKDRNVKMEELRDYCRDIKDVAAIALSNKPQLLEKLGVLVRS